MLSSGITLCRKRLFFHFYLAIFKSFKSLIKHHFMGTQMVSYYHGYYEFCRSYTILFPVQTGLTCLNNLQFINVPVMAVLCHRSVVFLQQPEPF